MPGLLDKENPKLKGTLLGPMLSYHFGDVADQNYNQNNVGLGYMSPSGLVGGYYQNSLHKPSFYAGKHFDYPLAGNGLLNAGVTVGGVTGYPIPLAPMVVPELSAKLEELGTLALMLQPPVGKYTKGALALQIRKELK